MDMLSYSKEREPTLEPTDLNDVVREVVELMAARARGTQRRPEGGAWTRHCRSASRTGRGFTGRC